MSLSTKEKLERIEWLKTIVHQAGDIVLRYYNQDAKIQWKTANEPVTEADMASNEFIVNHISKQFPDEGLLAEETFDDLQRLQKKRVWMIDPMDGTKEFISRNGEFSVMVGLVEEGAPILGIVYQPTEKRMYIGAKNAIAIMEDDDEVVDLNVSDRNIVSQLRLVVSRSHLEPIVEDIRRNMEITDLRQSGSVGIKCGLIARGECDVYIHPTQHAKLWDSCGPQAILEAAGGRMTDLHGNPLVYFKENVQNLNGLVASNGIIHDEIIEKISEAYEEVT